MLQENPRKKPRITKIHLLVHPFYGNRKFSRLIEFYDKMKGILVISNEKILHLLDI